MIACPFIHVYYPGSFLTTQIYYVGNLDVVWFVDEIVHIKIEIQSFIESAKII